MKVGDDVRGKVRGVVASRRKKGDRVSVWVGDARKLGAVVDVGRMVSCSLPLPAILDLAISLTPQDTIAVKRHNVVKH